MLPVSARPLMNRKSQVTILRDVKRMTKFNANKSLNDLQSRAESRANQEYHHASTTNKLQPCLTITVLPSTSYVPEDSKSFAKLSPSFSSAGLS